MVPILVSTSEARENPYEFGLVYEFILCRSNCQQKFGDSLNLMRAPNRSPMPDLALLLDEINLLLQANGLPQCRELEPVLDGDTANPNVVAYSDELKYVVKVTQRHPDTLNEQLKIANAIREVTDLPIPFHHCCSNVDDRFPLMIMDWLPGEQLRVVLSAAEEANLRRLCANLGACLANFHDPNHLTLVSDVRDSFNSWLYAQTLSVLEEMVTKPRPGQGVLFDTVAVRSYLDSRLDDLSTHAIPALGKADLDMRDFLVDPSNLEITGMLDWERVTRGDGAYALALNYLRLWQNGKLGGWKDFCESYNRLATVQARQSPQFEFYLMCRAVIAYQFNDGVQKLIDQLLRGAAVPFKRE